MQTDADYWIQTAETERQTQTSTVFVIKALTTKLCQTGAGAAHRRRGAGGQVLTGGLYLETYVETEAG